MNAIPFRIRRQGWIEKYTGPIVALLFLGYLGWALATVIVRAAAYF